MITVLLVVGAVLAAGVTTAGVVTLVGRVLGRNASRRTRDGTRVVRMLYVMFMALSCVTIWRLRA
jgi:hypothetical protein